MRNESGMEIKETQTDKIKVPIETLKRLMSMAKQGEGDIRNVNNPEAARKQLTAIFFEIKKLLEE